MKYGQLTLGQVEALVNKVGGMEGVMRLLAGEQFTLRERASERMVELIKLDYDPTPQEVAQELEKRGLAQPTAEDAHRFKKQHPKASQKHAIVFLCESASSGECEAVAVYSRESDLRMCWYGDRWSRYCVFAGIRE